MSTFENWVDEYFSNSSMDMEQLQRAFEGVSKTPKRIVYAISGNPPTWGHGDIMMRAAEKFDHLYWVAGFNPFKNLDFSGEERMVMMQKYVDYYKIDNVTVDCFEGTTIRYAEKKGAQFLLRGLRNSTDFQSELEMAAGNRGVIKEIETISMFTKPHFATISSTIVRELAMLGESIDQYVLPSIVDMIMDKLGPIGPS